MNKHAEAQSGDKGLRARLAHYVDLFENAPLGYVTLSCDGVILEINRSCVSLLAGSSSQLFGKRFESLVVDDERSAFNDFISKVTRNQGKEACLITLLSSGRPLQVRVTGSFLAGQQHFLAGEPMILLIIDEVIDRYLRVAQDARAEAERANRTMDLFLATLSHELRTPLSSLLLQSRLLRRGKLDEEKLSRAADAIERATNAQAQIINDLLDISRIMSGKLVLDLNLKKAVGH